MNWANNGLSLIFHAKNAHMLCAIKKPMYVAGTSDAATDTDKRIALVYIKALASHLAISCDFSS